MKIVILGAGNWGTTLAIALAFKDRQVSLWTRSSATAKELTSLQENKKYLAGIAIPQEVKIVEKYSESITAEDLLIFSIPSNRVREAAIELFEHVDSSPVIVSASKGLEYGSFKTMSQVIKDVLPNVNVAVLTGPTIAREIAQGQPARAVLACDDVAILLKVSKALENRLISFDLSNDPVGAELCGALKGIVAIGVGIADGLGLGANIQGLILAYGLQEFVKIAEFLSVRKDSIYGLPGLADVATTCLSKNSRNRRLGYLLGKGLKLDEALREVGMAVEGVNMVRTTMDLSSTGMSIPILQWVAESIFRDPGNVERIKSELYDIL